jgi:hypothetical protein
MDCTGVFFFGFFLGAGLVLVLVIKKKLLRRSQPDSEFIACPFCTEPVRTGAIACKHCHRSLKGKGASA